MKGANRALLAFLADNLASNKLKLGGFKMSVIRRDGMDPVFAIIEELLVIGGDMVLFCVRNCRVRYFDDHYHAYVVDHTSEQSLTVELLERNVYHAHAMSDGFSYISLKHSFMYIIQEMFL